MPPPQKKTVRKDCSKVKSMFAVTLQSYALWILTTQGQTVNQHYYSDALRCLQENRWSGTAWKVEFMWLFLQHDNALACSALSMCEFLPKTKRPSFRDPRLHQIQWPCNHFLFRNSGQCYGVGYLTTWPWFEANHRIRLPSFKQRAPQTATNGDTIAGLNASKKTILKGTTMIRRWVLPQRNNIRPQTM